MKRPTRRAAIALVIAVTVFTAVVAFAAQLNVTSAALQAGSASVGQVCTGTLATSYTTSGVGSDGLPLVQTVIVDPIAGACANGTGYNVTVYLEKGAAPTFSTLGVGITATAVTIATTNTFTAATGATATGTTLVFNFWTQNLSAGQLSAIAVVIS